jgi:hypothetical protein
MKRLMELVKKEKLTVGELQEIENMPEVLEREFNGASGYYIGWNWYTIITEDNEEYDVYVK